MPTPLAVALLVILGLMIIVALGSIVYEAIKEVRRILEQRATSASWVSSEEPGLLDYEADGERAMKRFTREMAGFGKETGKLGNSLTRHTQRFQNPALKRNPRLKQKRANQAAKSIDRSAVYIEKRAALLKALVKDVSRNYIGLIATASIETDEDQAAAQTFINILTASNDVVTGTIEKTAVYRDTVRGIQQQNLSRTIRIATKRLANSLEDAVKILKDYKQQSRRWDEQLTHRLTTKRSAPDTATSQPQPTS